MPFSGDFSTDVNCRWSSYRPKKTVFQPDYLKVYFQRSRIEAELAPTERGGFFHFKGCSGQSVGVALIAYFETEFSVNGSVVSGWTSSHTPMWGINGLREYFYIVFSSPISSYTVLENGGVALKFNDCDVDMKMATGFISVDQSKLNYAKELDGQTFEKVREKAADTWNGYLDSVSVSNENPDMVKTFYSCLYRALLYPRKFCEYNENNEPIHYNEDTKKCEKGVFYTDNGFWDTYRTVYPFLSILRPELVREMVEGFVNYSEETGWLPKWLSPGEIGIMPGTLVEAVIADACVKGIVSGELRSRAYKSLKRSAYESGVGVHGRQAISDYIKYGYVPNNHRESINHTCDCAYGDFCISVVARMEGDIKVTDELLARSKSYENIFDPETKFLRSKDKNGRNRFAFNPYDWGGDSCEGSSWQNSFAVYHDVDGLMALHGGKESFAKRLGELFSAEPIYEVGGYGQEIHEMSKMACVDFGQMAISNQPSFHIPWLYVMADQMDRAIYWVEKLAKEAFSCDIGGFLGDEDNGTTSCWFVFACMGFYPVCPGKDTFVCTKPLFREIKINGKTVKQDLPNEVRFDNIFSLK